MNQTIDINWMPDKTPSWNWDDYNYKVAPVTAEEASKCQGRIFKNDAERSEYQIGFVAGAQWQKEQDNEENR